MKICITYLGKKGAGGIYTIEMAKVLSLKCQVLVIVSAQSDNISDWRKSGLNIIELDTYEEVINLRGQINRVLSTLDVIKFFRLKKRIDEFDPDVIYHTMSYPLLPIINLISMKYKKILTIHDPKIHCGEENFILERINKLSLKQADRIVILSKVFKDSIVKMGINEDSIDIIPHGNFSFYKKSGAVKGAVKNTILFLGRIEKYKGLHILLNAYELIKQRVKDAKLIIAGSGDLNKYDEQLNRLEDIEIINKWLTDEEIEQIVSRSNFLVLPYIEASQSGVIPMAYAFRLPVVASDLGGLPEQIIHNQTGILVEPENVLNLAESCIRLLENPGIIKQMGQCGYEYSKKYMDWNYCGSLLLKSAEKLLNN